MGYEPFPSEASRQFAIELLSRRQADILDRVPPDNSPSSEYYASLRLTRKRYFSSYIDYLREAIEAGDTTDFLGNETFQSYTHSKDGFELKEVLRVILAVKEAVRGLMIAMVTAGEAEPALALGAMVGIEAILDEAQTIRAQSYAQTREEVIKFHHDYQEEIDRFPSDLAATLDFSTLMRSSVKKCIELVCVGRVAFFTRDLVSNELHLMASNFDHERAFGDSSILLDEAINNQLVHEKKSVLVEGYRRSLPHVTSIMKRMKTKVVFLIPLLVRDRAVGVVLLDNQERPQMFTPEVRNLATRFANKVAAAMENARLHGSEQQKLKETMALLEVSRLVTSTLDIDVLLSRLVQITADVCEVGKCSVYIYMGESDRFFPAGTFGLFPNSEWETSIGEGVHPDELPDEERKLLIEQHQVVISDPHLSPFILADRIEDTHTRSVVLVPVYSRDHLLGIMVLFYQKEKDELDSDDLNLVTAIASQAAVAIENASLYEDLEMSYFSTVKALARAIEVKDPYTFGHSEKVTEYAMAIARSMGLPEHEMQNIKYAAALHDIGKIGIARKVLNKPGALSEEEFLHVKTHPELGDSIIEPVAFLQGPREIIIHHHERYDGKGYPDGLSGDEIPIGARILAIADSFEAMMSDRPYRNALPVQVALKEIEINAGTQFDPEVVKAFLLLYREGTITLQKEEEPLGEDELAPRTNP